jgi:hypothetical protein
MIDLKRSSVSAFLFSLVLFILPQHADALTPELLPLPSRALVSEEETFTLDVKAVADKLLVASFTLQFDSSIVEYVGYQASRQIQVHHIGDSISVTVVFDHEESSETYGMLDLITLNFRALRIGNVDFRFKDDSIQLVDSRGLPVPNFPGLRARWTRVIVGTGMTLERYYGSPGDRIGGRATGLTPSEIVSLRLEDANVTTSPSPIIASDKGEIEFELVIPDLPFGLKDMELIGNLGKRYQTSFLVEPRLESVEPINVKPGSQLRLQGSGFPPNFNLKIYPEGVDLQRFDSDGYGRISINLSLPELSGGSKGLWVYQDDELIYIADDVFTVIPDIEVIPKLGGIGQEFSITGRAFVPGEIVEIRIEDREIKSIIADEKGMFESSFTLVEEQITQSRSADLPILALGERSGLSGVQSIRYIPNPRISNISPDRYVYPDQEVELTCEGFPSTSLIEAGFDHLPLSDIRCFDINGLPLNREYLQDGSFGRYIVPPNGIFILKFDVPNLPRGSKTLEVKAVNSHLVMVREEVFLEPAISADVRGTVISVEGDGFKANSEVRINIKREQPDKPEERVELNRTARTNEYGSFQTSFAIVDEISGIFTVTVSDDPDEKGRKGEAKCRIVISRRDEGRFLYVSPSSVKNGEEIEIQGAGFTPLRTVGVYIEDDVGLNRFLTSGSTDEMGYFSSSAVISGIPRAGKKRISVILDGQKVKEAEFTLMESLGIDRNSGSPGDVVNISGSGYEPYLPVKISFGKMGYEKKLAEGNVDEFGSFSLPIPVPLQEYGDKVFKVEIGDQTEYLSFRVLPGITDVWIERGGGRVQGYYAQAGDVLHVIGYGFVDGEEIEVKFGGLTVDGLIGSIKASKDGYVEVALHLTEQILRGRENEITITGSESGYPVSYPEPIIAEGKLELVPDRGEPNSLFVVKGALSYSLRFGSDNALLLGYDPQGNPIVRVPSNIAGGEYVVTDGFRSAKFTVTPSLYFLGSNDEKLRQISGEPNQLVELYGEGFTPGRVVKIALGIDGIIETVEADGENGKFTKSLILSRQPGGQVLIVADDGTLSASATVVYSPEVEGISQKKLKLTVEGMGFGPNEGISVRLSDMELQVVEGDVTDRRGSFRAECVLPTRISGGTIEVKGSRSGFTASKDVTISTSTPSLTISPSKGTLETQVQIKGDWFFPEEEIAIDFGDDHKTTKADINGGFKLIIPVLREYPDDSDVSVNARGLISGVNASGVFRYKSRIRSVVVDVADQTPRRTGDVIVIKAYVNDDVFKAVSGKFQIGENIQGELLKADDGIWSAQYVVEAGDHADGEQVIVTLTDSFGHTAAKASDKEIWIDAIVQITDVKISPDKAGAGVEISVEVEAEPGCTGTFSIHDVAQDIPLEESSDHPGRYLGSYTVKPGDEASGQVLTISLTDKYGNLGTKKSFVEIDTIARISQISIDKDIIKRGESVKITVKGEAKSKVRLSIGAEILGETEMIEDEDGIYSYTFSPPDGIEEYEIPLTVSLTDPLGNVVSDSSRYISIDTVPPKIYGVQLNRYRVANGDEIEIEALSEPGCTMEVDLSSLDTTRSDPVEFSEVEPGNFLLSFKISPENLASDGEKMIELRATDRAGNIGSYKVKMFLKNWYSFKLRLKRGLNLITIPVNDSRIERLSDVVNIAGPSCVAVVYYDSDLNKFAAYTRSMDPGSPKDALVKPGEGYIVIMGEPAEVEFEGKKWSGEVVINSRIALFGLPVKDQRIKRAGDLIELSEGAIERIIKIDPVPRIISYSPALPDDSPSNFLISPGEGYILILRDGTIPLTLRLSGGGWEN